MKLKQILLFAVSMALVSVPISAIQEPASPRNLIGAWRLSARESGGSPIQNPRGLLVLDRVGNLLVISTRAGRSAYASSQPTPGEARAAFDTYDGFFGKYNVTNAKDLTVSIEGGLNPGRIGKSTKWSLNHQADRLIVDTPEWGRMTWAYLPELGEPSPLQRQMFGFWQLVTIQRVTTSGEVVSTGKRSPSIIVYTPSGHVGVHFQPEIRKPFVANTPTEQEAHLALQNYVSYMGLVLAFPRQRLLNHWLLAGLNPAEAGDTFQRLGRVDGSTATLRFLPVTVENGREIQIVATLRRLSGEQDLR